MTSKKYVSLLALIYDKNMMEYFNMDEGHEFTASPIDPMNKQKII